MAGIDDFAKLMLLMNGSDASTTFTDNSPAVHTMTANGNAQIDTAQSKFGGASGLFDGNGDYIDTPVHADWYMGAGDFTVDFQVRRNALASLQVIYNQANASNDLSSKSIQILLNADNTVSVTVIKDDGSTTADVTSTTTLSSTSTWYHIEVVRDGNTLRLFVDGTEEDTADITGWTLNESSNKLTIGKNGEATGGATFYFDGWLDEFRVTKGLARNTINFTAPTEQYSFSGDGALNLPQLSIQAASAPGAELTLPVLSVSAQTSPGASLTLPILSLNANDVPPASASISLPVLSVVAGYNAAADITFPSLSVSAERKFHGEISITLPALVETFTALQGSADGTTISLPAFTVNIRTGITNAMLLPQLSLNIVGHSGFVGTYNKNLPRMTINVKATQQSRGTYDVSLPAFTLDATLLTGEISLASTRNIPGLRLGATGFVGGNGDVDLTFPAFELATMGFQSLNGTVVQSLKMLTLDAYADSYTNRII